jgi:hypothetical protein
MLDVSRCGDDEIVRAKSFRVKFARRFVIECPNRFGVPAIESPSG